MKKIKIIGLMAAVLAISMSCSPSERASEESATVEDPIETEYVPVVVSEEYVEAIDSLQIEQEVELLETEIDALLKDI